MESVVIGYSGHAFVAIETLRLGGINVVGYFDNQKKKNNPYNLDYLGPTTEKAFSRHSESNFFIAIGDNVIREQLYNEAINYMNPLSVIHPSAVISSSAMINHGAFIGANVVINAYAKIGTGVICNTGSIIEHECIIDDFAHLAPSTVICGSVKVGARAFIGADTVVVQGVKIDKEEFIKAGSRIK